MKKLLIAAVLLVPNTAIASEHMDVIEFKLVEGCTLAKQLEITKDFNKWGKAYSYHAKIAAPLQSGNLNSYFWLGTSPNAASFGAAWDAWRDAQSNQKSEAAKLQARFSACEVNVGRRSYDVY